MLRSKFLLAALFVCASFSAHATTVFIQTAAATGGTFTDTSRIQAAGANDSFNITLDGPAVTADLYVLSLQVFTGTKTSSTATLNDQIHVVTLDGVTQFSGLFAFTQPVAESVLAGAATFSASQGPSFTMHLTNGEFLTITPLANLNIATSGQTEALYQLSSTAPEPSAVLFVGAGLLGLAAFGRKLRRS
jgi:hypothetical protein